MTIRSSGVAILDHSLYDHAGPRSLQQRFGDSLAGEDKGHEANAALGILELLDNLGCSSVLWGEIVLYLDLLLLAVSGRVRDGYVGVGGVLWGRGAELSLKHLLELGSIILRQCGRCDQDSVVVVAVGAIVREIP